MLVTMTWEGAGPLLQVLNVVHCNTVVQSSTVQKITDNSNLRTDNVKLLGSCQHS